MTQDNSPLGDMAGVPSKVNDGGDAFPACGNPETDQFMRGMSLRDWFAGMALQGILASGKHHTGADENGGKLAGLSYAYADAMLKARGQ